MTTPVPPRSDAPPRRPDIDHDTAMRLAALEFCRRLSGRGNATGLLATAVPF